jgi:hypothetical protein
VLAISSNSILAWITFAFLGTGAVKIVGSGIGAPRFRKTSVPGSPLGTPMP